MGQFSGLRNIQNLLHANPFEGKVLVVGKPLNDALNRAIPPPKVQEGF
jgi:hypothetical protein